MSVVLSRYWQRARRVIFTREAVFLPKGTILRYAGIAGLCGALPIATIASLLGFDESGLVVLGAGLALAITSGLAEVVER